MRVERVARVKRVAKVERVGEGRKGRREQAKVTKGRRWIFPFVRFWKTPLIIFFTITVYTHLACKKLVIINCRNVL